MIVAVLSTYVIIVPQIVSWDGSVVVGERSVRMESVTVVVGDMVSDVIVSSG